MYTVNIQFNGGHAAMYFHRTKFLAILRAKLVCLFGSWYYTITDRRIYVGSRNIVEVGVTHVKK